ncbi:uncharacterized protein (DUF1499 family) [Psychrobacter sp. PL15]|uniref:DUF1499 domain-containing protein n=1 Tax=Psychrobacter sp. PL15 TaxID=3071719 RepID=UPI002DFC8394|nr:uncharacterized protein (DUF1499 family) [Psychrobacter sp. PL15]
MKVLVTLISLIALLLVVLPGPLYKFGIVDLGTAFAGFKFGVYAGIAALVLLLLQFLLKRDTMTLGSSAIVVVFSVFSIAMPLSMMNTAKSVPPIHDISTDLVNPPEFVAIAPLRANAPNPVEYAGEASAEQQRQAYPELKTLNYSQPKAELVSAVEQAAKNLGWELINADASNGIIEATHTSTWFGFEDDVIVRVNDQGNERLVDIRSKSRIGGSDLGKNAARIHTLMEELDTVLAE